jgi:quaternary ammonium compound-resistance protein SugE
MSGTARRSGDRAVAWFLLFIAGLLEVAWASLMKSSQGFTRLWPSLGTLLFMIGSFGLLAAAMRTLPLGTAYPIWTGIGAIGAFAVGVALFGEELPPVRALAVLMIVAGIVLMRLSSDA